MYKTEKKNLWCWQAKNWFHTSDVYASSLLPRRGRRRQKKMFLIHFDASVQLHKYTLRYSWKNVAGDFFGTHNMMKFAYICVVCENVFTKTSLNRCTALKKSAHVSSMRHEEMWICLTKSQKRLKWHHGYQALVKQTIEITSWKSSSRQTKITLNTSFYAVLNVCMNIHQKILRLEKSEPTK